MKAHNHVHNIAQKFDVLSESVTINVPLISSVVKDPMFLLVFALSRYWQRSLIQDIFA